MKMMKRIQIAIIPGIVGGIFCLIGVTMLLLPTPELQSSISNGSQSSKCEANWRMPSRIRAWCYWITEYAFERQLNPLLIAAIIQQESGGNPNAISKNGAVGLMQVMPGDGKALTFQCTSGPCFSDRPSSKLLLDPEYNISYGTELISNLLAATGNLRDALRAYGPLDVGYSYADQVLDLMERFK